MRRTGTFRYEIQLGDARSERFEVVSPWVDTGALYSQFPSSLLENLGHTPNAVRTFRLVDGSSMQRPVGSVPMRIGDEDQQVLCVFGEEESEMLLGATALETFSLAPDPVNEMLTPTVAMMLSMTSVEDTDRLTLDFDKLAKVAEVPGVLPCAVQNGDTGEVILVAYVNRMALERALQTRSAVFWSTSRNELWEKGKTSGETFDLTEIRVNCEQNSLVYIVRPTSGQSTGIERSGICHTKNVMGRPRNCFYRRLNFDTGSLDNLDP